MARAIAQGLSNAEIAEELYLSIATVKSHTGRLFESTLSRSVSRVPWAC
ncbi:LuxR C-terminal-related transcriptional regulator [Nocardia sp. NPDC051463]